MTLEHIFKAPKRRRKICATICALRTKNMRTKSAQKSAQKLCAKISAKNVPKISVKVPPPWKMKSRKKTYTNTQKTSVPNLRKTPAPNLSILISIWLSCRFSATEYISLQWVLMAPHPMAFPFGNGFVCIVRPFKGVSDCHPYLSHGSQSVAPTH